MADYSFLQAASDASDLTTYTFSSQNLGAADADRYIVVGIVARAGLGSAISSVSVGGVTATIVVQRENVGNTVGIAIAAVPSGATGDVVVTFATGRLRCTIGLWRMAGIDSATASDSDSSISTDPSVALDVPEGGFAVSVATIAAATTTAWSGLTEDFDLNPESTWTPTGASDEFASAQTGLTIQATFAAGASQDVLVAASWGPAASTGGSISPLDEGMLTGGFQNMSGGLA